MTALLLDARARIRCLIGGLAVLALVALAGLFDPRRFFEGCLFAFVFWTELAVGCLGLLFIQYLTGGRWGMTVTRLLEAAALTLPLCGVLFLPILAGLPWLFPWVHPQGAELRHLVAAKAAYLNIPFYVVRYLLYFGIFTAFALGYRRLSLRRDAGDTAARAAMGKWSGPCLILLVLCLNFSSVDWIMALSPKWYSSMLPVNVGADAGVVAMAWCILVLRWIERVDPMRGALNRKVVHDLGNLLLAFICFWTYTTFMEYIIVWTGDLPNEVEWFSDRSSAGWKWFAVVLVLVHFAIPLFCLIMTAVSKNLTHLARVAAFMLVAHFVQVAWWIEPAFGARVHIAWTSVVLTLALGAIWLAAFGRGLAGAALVPADLPPLPRPRNAA